MPESMTAAQWLWTAGGAGFAVGCGLGALIAWMRARTVALREAEPLKVRIAELEAGFGAATRRLEEMEAREGAALRENETLKIQVARLTELRSADAEKLQWLAEAKEQVRDTFDLLANQTLQSHSRTFLHQAREQVGRFMDQMRGDWRTQKAEFRSLVDPVRENLTSLDGHIRDLEQKREGAYQGLTEQLQHLSKTHADLRNTTITLAQALRSPTVRGRWGEMQLRRVVEMAGMSRHVAFEEQVSGNGGRPDMVIHLPGSGRLPVDSKVPLEAYMDAMESDREGERRVKLAHHAKAMRSRVRELGAKRYWEQFDPSPDFVVMFVPNEACLGAAFDSDPGLLEYAVGQQVLVTTPVTLLAMLKAVAFGWQQYRLTENTRRISEHAQELYRRFETFVDHLGDLGKQIGRTVDGYNRTVGSLERRLMPFARRFQEIRGTGEEPEGPEAVEAGPTLPKAVDKADPGGA